MRRTVQGEVVQAEDNCGLAGVEVDIYELALSSNRTTNRELLASLVTDINGGFSLEWDDTKNIISECANPESIKTAIYAEVFVSKKKVKSKRKQNRMPLASTCPREMARIIDSLIIRIPRAEVCKAGIKIPCPPEPVKTENISIEEEIKIELAEREKRIIAIKKGTKKELQRRIANKRKGASFAHNLLAKTLKPGTRKNKLFVSKPSEYQKVLEQNITKGVSKLSERKSKGIKVHIGEHVSKDIEDALKTSAGSNGKLPDDIAEKILESTRSGNKFIKTSDTLTEYQASMVSAEATESMEQESATEGDTNGTSAAPGSAEFSEEYNEALSQILELIKTRTDISIGNRPDTTAIADGLTQDLPLGPADTTAYYDFHSLEVAWEDTWTAAIDNLTADQITELYESIVEVIDPEIAEDIGITEAGPNNKLNFSSPREFLQFVASTVDSAQSIPGNAAPSELQAWVPQVSVVWSSLAPNVQSTISNLHALYKHVDSLKKLQTILPLAAMSHLANSIANSASALAAKNAVMRLLDDYALSGSYSTDLFRVLRDNILTTKVAAKDWAKDTANSLINGNVTEETGLSGTDGLDIDSLPPSLGRAEALLEGIKQRLAEPHKFDIFVPDSYNYGVFYTFRQKWKPLDYQVGKLVSSMPLAPGETRSYTKKQIIKTSRSTKELEKALSALKNDSSTSGRAEAEIISKANSNMNFSVSAQAGFNPEAVQFSKTASAGGSRGSESAKTKNSIREAVRSAAQEYSNERTLEVSTEKEVSGELVEEGEISNPNNELTVTYLFYELQRRFEISEKIHELTPVVLVAYEVPTPNEIDEDWLLTHAWILKRVILDDSFLKGLRYVSETFTGDEVGIGVMYKQWAAQMTVVEQIADNVSVLTSIRNQARDSLQRATESVAGKDGIFLDIHQALHGEGANEKDLIQARTDSAELSLDWVNEDFNSAYSRLQTASQALRQATSDYIGALKTQLNRRTAVDQVKIHVKENILYYMQAIWRHEHRDQRYFRLYDLEVKWPEAKANTSTVSAFTSPNPGFAQPFKPDPAYTVIPPKAEMTSTRKLHEVADLDQLIGFKGNYAIFPLNEANALTDYMSQDFLDNHFGVSDPDQNDEIMPRSEALEYVKNEWNKDGADKMALTQWLIKTLSSQIKVSEEIIVPTGQLHIEALPGTTPILEDFKLKHRAVDVRAAEGKLDLQLLEALRRAARLSTNDLTDPDVDKSIHVNSNGDDPSVMVET